MRARLNKNHTCNIREAKLGCWHNSVPLVYLSHASEKGRDKPMEGLVKPELCEGIGADAG